MTTEGYGSKESRKRDLMRGKVSGGYLMDFKNNDTGEQIQRVVLCIEDTQFQDAKRYPGVVGVITEKVLVDLPVFFGTFKEIKDAYQKNLYLGYAKGGKRIEFLLLEK